MMKRPRNLSRFLGASERTPDGFRFILPLPPNEGNKRPGHWTVRHGKVKQYHKLLDDLAIVPRFPLPWVPTPDKVRLTVALYLWNLHDTDGAVARCKLPIDWLVRNDYAVNDSPKHLEWAGMPEQHIDRKWQRIELTLEARDHGLAGVG